MATSGDEVGKLVVNKLASRFKPLEGISELPGTRGNKKYSYTLTSSEGRGLPF